MLPPETFSLKFDPSQWTLRDRANGAFYRGTWRGAQVAGADLAILTSYNERAEQTDIQPLPEWGNQYLAMTAARSNEWRSA